MPTLIRLLILIFQRKTIGKEARVKSVRAAMVPWAIPVALIAWWDQQCPFTE